MRPLRLSSTVAFFLRKAYSDLMADEEQPQFKSEIHGHPVYCDDEDAREYLRHLDNQEADVIFSHAKVHGNADFEISDGGTRYNYSMTYHNGGYSVVKEGKEGSGWF